MDNATLNIPLDSMDIIALKNLRKETSKRITKIKTRDALRIGVYISADIRNKLDVAVRWAYIHKHIKRESYWSFCKFCISNTVLIINTEIAKEAALKAKAANSNLQGFNYSPDRPPINNQEPPEQA